MDLKRFLPQAVAIVLFALITAFFFSPLVFDGKRVRQGDITQFAGASKEIKDFREKTGEEALWTNSMFGGMPAYQISVQYPNNMMQYIQRGFMKIMPAPATFILLCMVGFYFLLLTFKVDPWLSIAGAIAFGLSSYFITLIPAGHNTKGFAIAYMAPVLMGVILTMRGRLLLGGAFTALALALEIYSNHLQITYYLMILVLLVGIGESIRLVKEKQVNYLFKAAGILVAAALLAVLPNITNLALTNEYGKASTRGQSEITLDDKEQKKTSGLPIEYATQWSYGKAETFTLLIPDFHGGASDAIDSYSPGATDDVDPQYKEYIGKGQAAYFGDVSFTSGPYYAGAIICFLFILGLFIVKDNIKWWLLAATVLAIMLAWGRHFMGFTEFFFYNVPGYNKFRAVSMILVVVQLTMPLLAMLAVREIVRNPGELKTQTGKRAFWISFALTGGIAFLVWIMPSTFVDTIRDRDVQGITRAVTEQGGGQDVVNDIVANLEIARLNIVSSDALRSFFFILLAAGLLYFYIRKPFGVLPLAGGLTLLVLIDMWGVGHRYISKDNYEKPKKNENAIALTEADKMILRDTSKHYRVANIATDTWQDGTTSFYHKSIGGYHGAKLKRVQELYEQVMAANLNQVGTALNMKQQMMERASKAPDSLRMMAQMQAQMQGDSVVDQTLSNLSAVNMLNTKYFIYNPAGGVLTNPHAAGNAWFVSEVKIVPDSDEELKAVKTFDPKKTAVVEKSFEAQLAGFKPQPDAKGTIRLLSYAPNHLVYESNSSVEQLAVFSEVYYEKGWKAFIDTKPVEHMRADFLLRALRVPSGRHTIEFKFEPDFYFTGEKIALAGSLMLLAFFAGAIFLDVRKRKNAKQAA